MCLDVHQFVACISVCHSDHINHPKSKQIFTLMDAQRKGEVVLDDFVQIFESTGGAEELAVVGVRGVTSSPAAPASVLIPDEDPPISTPIARK